MNHPGLPSSFGLSQKEKIKELPLMSETTQVLASLEKEGVFKIMEGIENCLLILSAHGQKSLVGYSP